MTRDMELVRTILKAVQARQDVQYAPLSIEGPPNWLVQRHVEMLIEAGLLQGVVGSDNDDGYPEPMVRDLTWEGHEFIGALANESVWARVKQIVAPAELATAPIAIVKAILMKVAEAYLLREAGLG